METDQENVTERQHENPKLDIDVKSDTCDDCLGSDEAWEKKEPKRRTI